MLILRCRDCKAVCRTTCLPILRLAKSLKHRAILPTSLLNPPQVSNISIRLNWCHYSGRYSNSCTVKCLSGNTCITLVLTSGGQSAAHAGHYSFRDTTFKAPIPASVMFSIKDQFMIFYRKHIWSLNSRTSRTWDAFSEDHKRTQNTRQCL